MTAVGYALGVIGFIFVLLAFFADADTVPPDPRHAHWPFGE